MKISILFLAIAACVACPSLAWKAPEFPLPDDEKVNKMLEKCIVAPKVDDATRKHKDLLAEQEKNRGRGRRPRPVSQRPKNGTKSESMADTILKKTKEGVDILDTVSEKITDSKFAEKGNKATTFLQDKAIMKVMSARLRSGNLNVQRQAKAMATLAKAAKGILGAIGTVASFLGPVAAGVGILLSIVSMFIPQPDPNQAVLDAIKTGFERMTERFDAINWKLENLELTVEKTALYTIYKRNQDRLRNVHFKYTKFSQSPSNITLQELQETCHLYDPELSLAWIYRTVMEDRVGADLLPTILKDVKYDRDQLIDWMQIIITDVIQASFLREVCVGVRFGEIARKGKATAQDLDQASKALVGNRDFLCSLDYGRQEADRMLTDITKRLDKFENELLDNFKRVQLEKDLEEYARDFADRKACDVRRLVKEQLEQKYYWCNFLVVMSCGEGGEADKVPPIRPITNNLYAQTLVKTQTESPDYCKSNKIYLSAIPYEKDALIPPPVEKGVFEMDTTVDWENHKFFDAYKKGYYDNIVLVRLNENGFRLACDLDYPDMAKNNVFYKSHKGREKYTSNDTNQIITSAGRNGYDFFVYYNNRNLANTYHCRASFEVLKNASKTRADVCSQQAFKGVVLYETSEHNKRFPYPAEFEQSKLKESAKQLQEILSNNFSDFRWIVYGTWWNHSWFSCPDNTSNCVDNVKNDTYRLTVIWSEKCDVSTFVENAKSDFKFLQDNWREIFNKTLVHTAFLRDFIQAPQQYMKYSNLVELLKKQEGYNKTTFTGPKVLVFTAVNENPNSNASFVAGDDKEVYSFTMRLEGPMKVFWQAERNYQPSDFEVEKNYEPMTALKVFMAFYEPYGNPSCPGKTEVN